MRVGVLPGGSCWGSEATWKRERREEESEKERERRQFQKKVWILF